MKISQLLLLGMIALLAFGSTAYAGCQDEKKQDEPTEESMAELQEAMDNLAAALKDKDHSESKSMIDKIAVKYKGGDKALKDKAVAALKGCLKNKEKSVRNAAITSLGQTGGKAVKILMKGAKSAKKDANLQQRYLTAAGKLRDDKNVGDLLKYLNNKDNNTIKTVIYAVGFYNEKPTKLRKEIVKSLLKQYASVASAFRKPNPSSADKSKYETLYNPFESTLKKLTKQELEGFDNWDKWYRKDGKKRKEW